MAYMVPIWFLPILFYPKMQLLSKIWVTTVFLVNFYQVLWLASLNTSLSFFTLLLTIWRGTGHLDVSLTIQKNPVRIGFKVWIKEINGDRCIVQGFYSKDIFSMQGIHAKSALLWQKMRTSFMMLQVIFDYAEVTFQSCECSIES